MEELGGLMAQAEKLAATETEKQRVALWRKALWEWMCQGREQYLATQTGPVTSTLVPGQRPSVAATRNAWGYLL